MENLTFSLSVTDPNNLSTALLTERAVVEYEEKIIGSIDASNGVHILYVVLLIIFTSAGNVGNLFVIGAVLMDKRLRKDSNMFIVNLAAADLCVTAFVDPFSISGALAGPDFFIGNDVLCHIIGSICLVSCVCSLYSIAAIRYVLLCRRKHYSTLYSFKKMTFWMAGLWTFSLLLDIPNFFGWGDHSYDMKTLSCSYDRTASYSYTVFFISFFVLVPLAIVVFCNINIYIVVVRSGLKIAAHKEFMTDAYSVTQATTYQQLRGKQNSSVADKEEISNPVETKLSTCQEDESAEKPSGNNMVSNTLSVPMTKKSTKPPSYSPNGNKSDAAAPPKKKIHFSTEVKLAKTLFIVFLVFCLCWSPYAMICLIDRFDKQPKEAYMFSILLAHSSSTLNSIVYALTNKGFRDGYKKVLNKVSCGLICK